MARLEPIILLLILIIPCITIPNVKAQQQNITVTSSSTTSANPGNFTTTNIPQNKLYVPQFTGTPVTDIGKISFITMTNNFQWNVSSGESMSLGLPILVTSNSTLQLSTSIIYVNSTVTQYRLSGFTSNSITSSYFVTITFKPNQYNTKISFDGSVSVPLTLQLPFTSTGNNISLSRTGNIKSGSESFSWSDIPLTYNPIWNQTSKILSISLNGVFNIDPLALDGSAVGSCSSPCTSYTMTLTTTNSPDAIIVYGGGNCGGASPSANTVTDSSSLTWKKRIHLFVTGFAGWVDEFAANSSGTLTNDVITFHLSGCGSANMAGIAFGISGASTTTSTFDSNAGLPFTGHCSGGGCGVAVDTVTGISTSNANDMLISGDFNGNGGGAFSGGSPSMTFINVQTTGGGGETASQYKVVSSTQSSITVTYAGGDSDGFSYGMIVDAVKSGATTVIQPIKLITANSAPQATITWSGCALSNGTALADGFTKTMTVTSSCTITLTNPASGTYTRYCWNISPKPFCTTSNIHFTTCLTGTCSLYQNTTYYQLRNNYTENAQTPNKWNGQYSNGCTNSRGLVPTYCNGYNSPTGIFDGTSITSASSTDMCYLTVASIGNMKTNQGDATGMCYPLTLQGYIWGDYNQALCLPSMIGSWVASSTNCFTDTTGNNSHITNYVLSSGGVSDGLWPFGILLIGYGIIRYKPRSKQNGQ